MSTQPAKKFTWAIRNFSSLRKNRTYSKIFIVGGCKWNLFACLKGSNGRYLFLCLEVTGHGTLSPGWKRHARCLLNIGNQNSVNSFRQTERLIWFDKQSPRWSPKNLLTLKEIFAKDNGYLVNGELQIVAEIEVLEVIGGIDDVPEETLTIMETIKFNGFQLPPSQVEFLSNLFERHPQIASEFRLKNSNLRTGYMSLLIGLIETLRQWPDNKTSIDEAYATLKFMSAAGFKLDWLKKKLGEIMEKKLEAAIAETRIQEIKEELKVLKQKSLNLETQLKKEEAKILAAKAPLSFDDVL